MHRHIEFKRMIVGLPHSPRDYARLGVTSRLAELLKLNLVAMFADDRSLLHAAGLPCVRELRAPGGGWCAIDVEQLTAELARNATIARRRFMEAIAQCRVETRFEVDMRPAAEMVGALATAEDLVVIIEPGNPAERVTQQFTSLVSAAFRAAASMMFVPSRVARSAGPVVALARRADDPGIDVAATIAAAVRERLVVLGPEQLSGSHPLLSRLAAAEVAVQSVAIPPAAAATAPALAAELARWHERLVVTTRGTLDDAQALVLASLRSVPVVLVKPADAGEPDRNQ